jgi:hypothetical protein
VVQLISKLLTFPNVDVVVLGLDKQCLSALQAAVRRFETDNSNISNACMPIISALELVYTEQSGAAFEISGQKAIDALKAAEIYHRHVTEDGQMFYSTPGPDGSEQSMWDAPKPIEKLMESLLELDTMSRRIEEEAVSEVRPFVMMTCFTVIFINFFSC